MSTIDRRSRSMTGVSQRPRSRDSTTSLQSTSQRHLQADSQAQYSAQTQYAAQQHMITNQPQSFEQFTVMQHMPQQQFQSHGLPIAAEQQYYNAQLQNQNTIQYHSHQVRQASVDAYATMGSQQMNPQHAQPAAAEEEETKKRGGAAATQSNEKELRASLEQNLHRTLKDVAKEVLDSERTTRAEKTKQLFAMLWLNASCETAKTSVPRSRVYASYADRCATERVQPLNPASFGKLVRIIFKGIQTRRLGVRGESKYHYVDLALKSDNPENNENTFGRGIFGHEPRSPQSMQLDFSAVPQLTANATFNADGSPIASPILAPRGYAGQGDGAVFAEPYNVTEFRSKFPYSQTYAQRLCFPNIEDEITTTDVQLPNVWPYAPEGADEDAADALQALYRSHCTSLIEYFKKCKEKQFWRMFTTFQGTLTVPVQKLLTAPSMAAWVRECDYYMYQRMLAFLAPIALQVLPPAALIFFDSISHGLHAHIIKTFSGLPLHVLEARLEPATRFCELINRMIKVNNAAHAASQVLEYNEHREQLHQEWRRYINPKRIMEGELPGCGYEQTFKILTDEMAALLRPLTPPPVYEDGLPYANPNAQTDGADNYIDRIDTLLRSLPTRFPQAPARTIVDCVKNLGTAAMREFTMQGANSFHAWWIVKVFIDEYSQWLVTSGGFMAHRPGRRAQSSPDAGGSLTNGAVESSVEDSRHSSVALIDKDEMMNGMTRPSLRKRRSNELDNDEVGESRQNDTKKLRLTPETEDAPQFQQLHPSFATSFDSAGAGTAADTRPDMLYDAAEMPEFEDSGIGLGLLGDSPARSTRKALAAKKMTNIDRAQLVQQDVESGTVPA